MTNLVSLETFRKEMQFHPFHFWQLANASTPVSSDCPDLVYEYGWKANSAAGRDDLRRALETAEQKLSDYLGYSVGPHYATAIVDFPRFYDQSLARINQGGADGRWLSVHLPEAKIISVGIETLDSITTLTQADLTFIDSDGDGLADVWLATFATSITDPDEIAVYYGLNDRVDAEPVGERWRIWPLQVTLSGGVCTLRGKPWQIVRPIKYEGVSSAALDPTLMANYALSLDVYRRYIDPTGTTNDTAQAKLIWETPPYPAWSECLNCGDATDSSTDPAAVAYALARVGLRDVAQGLVSLGEAIYSASSGLWSRQSFDGCRPPDRVEIRYRAGDDLDNWTTTICRLAAAELGKRASACDAANKELYRYQIDLAFSGNAAIEKMNISTEDLNNPFGTRLGQVLAYKQVKRLSTAVGIRA
jgi:hypothetical protein